MDNTDRAIYGDDALRAGTPDYFSNDHDTNAIDTIANIMHSVVSCGGSIERVIAAARDHFYAELADTDPAPDHPYEVRNGRVQPKISAERLAEYERESYAIGEDGR